MPFDVFISYSHRDKAAADAACSALESAGLRCWIAPRDVAPGADWAAAIVNAIDHCRAMVVIFSSGANQSKQIYREVQRAFEKELPVVPLRIENVIPESMLAYYMGPVHWLDALTPPLEDHLKQLVTSVSTILQSVTSREPAGDLRKPDRDESAAGGERRGQIVTPVQPPASPSPRWMLASAAIIGLAIIAAAALWSHAQKPAPVVTQEQQKSAPAPLITQQQPQPAPAVVVPAPVVPEQPPPQSPPAPAAGEPPPQSTPAPSTGTPAAGCSSSICGTWKGTGNTASTQFGGSPHCKYSVSLQKPALDVTVDETGEVTKANLVLTMVENIVGSCAFQSLGTQAHSYEGGGTTKGTSVQLELKPAPENKPRAMATFSGEVVDRRLVGTLTVHRTGVSGDLVWKVQSAIR